MGAGPGEAGFLGGAGVAVEFVAFAGDGPGAEVVAVDAPAGGGPFLGEVGAACGVNQPPGDDPGFGAAGVDDFVEGGDAGEVFPGGEVAVGETVVEAFVGLGGVSVEFDADGAFVPVGGFAGEFGVAVDDFVGGGVQKADEAGGVWGVGDLGDAGVGDAGFAVEFGGDVEVLFGAVGAVEVTADGGGVAFFGGVGDEVDAVHEGAELGGVRAGGGGVSGGKAGELPL